MECRCLGLSHRSLSSGFEVHRVSRTTRFRIRTVPKFTDTVSIYDAGYEPDVIIVGGGLAGLSCARTLHENSIPFALLESTDRSPLQSSNLTKMP